MTTSEPPLISRGLSPFGLVYLAPLVLLACGPAPEPTVVPPPVEPAPELAEIVEFSASTGTVALGGQVDLTWEVAGTATVSIFSDGDFEASVSASGVLTSPRLTETTRFTLRAENEAGVARADAIVAVRKPPEPASIERFEAFPEEFTGAVAEVGLSWRATGRLRLLAGETELTEFPGQRASFFTVRITEPTVFTLVSTGEDGLKVRAEARVRRTGVELEPNDRREQAQAIEPGSMVRGTITEGDVDWFSVAVPDGFSLSARLNESCGFPSQLELWGPDPERVGQVTFYGLDDRIEDPCARIDPAVFPAAVELSGGTYFLKVRGFDGSSAGAYELSLEVIAPGCGNGLVEVGRGEQCDPAGGLCGADCAFTGLVTHLGPPLDLELEPPAPVEVGLDEPGTVFGSLGGDDNCPELGLFDLDRTGGSTLLRLDGGSGRCGALLPEPLAPGRYLVLPLSEAPRMSVSARVRGCGDGIVDRGELCDEGGPTEGCGPDCRFRAAAVAVPGVPVTVDVPAQLTRFVQVEVPIAGSSISARVVGGAGAWSLGLHDGGFVEVASAEPGQPLLSGQPKEMDDLAAGEHHIAVTRHGEGTASVTIAIEVTPPECPDGIVQRRAGEQCEPQLGEVPCTSDCRGSPGAARFQGPGAPRFGTVVVPETQTTLGPGAMELLVVETSTFTVIRVRGGHNARFRCDGPAVGALDTALFDDQFRRLTAEPGPNARCPGVAYSVGPGTNYVRLKNDGPSDIDPVIAAGLLETARCGNSIVDGNEDCDRSINAFRSLCPSNCRFGAAVRREQEPNDDLRTAEPIDPRSSELILGRIPLGDRDLYSFELGRFDEFGLKASLYPPSRNCQFFHPRLRLLDHRGRTLIEATRTTGFSDPPRPCLEFDLGPEDRLLPGRYYLEVKSEDPLNEPYLLKMEPR